MENSFGLVVKTVSGTTGKFETISKTSRSTWTCVDSLTQPTRRP